MDEKKNSETKEEYKLEINKDNQKVFKTYNKQYKKEVNMIFDTEESDVMNEIVKQLSKYFAEDIINMEEFNTKNQC